MTLRQRGVRAPSGGLATASELRQYGLFEWCLQRPAHLPCTAQSYAHGCNTVIGQYHIAEEEMSQSTNLAFWHQYISIHRCPVRVDSLSHALFSFSRRSGASSPSAWIIARGQSLGACSEPLTCGYQTWSASRGPIATRHLLGDAVAVAHTPFGVTLTMWFEV